VRRRTRRYEAARRTVKAVAMPSWYGNTGTPPPPDVLEVVVDEEELDVVRTVPLP
jgi:hypothetical protein